MENVVFETNIDETSKTVKKSSQQSMTEYSYEK